jgi:hypothetical protein
MTREGQPEENIPVEHLHQRFDKAYDQAEMLSALIAQREGDGVDFSILFGKLKEAEAEKAALADLRKTRHLKVVPRAGGLLP